MGMIELQFLGEKLREVGEPSVEEQKRLEDGQQVPQAVLQSGPMAAQLLAQGQGAARGVAAMLQQGAGNRAVAAMLKGNPQSQQNQGEQPPGDGNDEKKRKAQRAEQQSSQPSRQEGEAPARQRTQQERGPDRMGGALQNGLARVMGRLGVSVRREAEQADDGARVTQPPRPAVGPAARAGDVLRRPASAIVNQARDLVDGAVAPIRRPGSGMMNQARDLIDGAVAPTRRVEPAEQRTGETDRVQPERRRSGSGMMNQARDLIDDAVAPTRRDEPSRQPAEQSNAESNQVQPERRPGSAMMNQARDLVDDAVAPARRVEPGPQPAEQSIGETDTVQPERRRPAGHPMLEQARGQLEGIVEPIRSVRPVQGPKGPGPQQDPARRRAELEAADAAEQMRRPSAEDETGRTDRGPIEQIVQPGLRLAQDPMRLGRQTLEAAQGGALPADLLPQAMGPGVRGLMPPAQAVPETQVAPEPPAGPALQAENTVEPMLQPEPLADIPTDLPTRIEPAAPLNEPAVAELSGPAPTPTVDEVPQPTEALEVRPEAVEPPAQAQPPEAQQAEAQPLEKAPAEQQVSEEAQVKATQELPKPKDMAPNGEGITAEPDAATMRGPSEIGSAVRTQPGEQRPQPTARVPQQRAPRAPTVGGQGVSVTQAPRLPRSQPEPALTMPPVPLSPAAERQLQQPAGPEQGPEDSPDAATPRKSRAQIDAEARMVGEKAKSEVKRVQGELGTEAEAEAQVKTRTAESERDQREQQAQVQGDQEIAAEEAKAGQQRAQAQAQGEQRKTQATAQAAQRETQAQAQGEQRKAAVEARREAEISAEEARGRTDEARAQARTEGEERRLRAEGDRTVAQFQAQGRDRESAHQAEGRRLEADARRATQEEKQQIREEGRRKAQEARDTGERDAGRAISEGQSRQRAEESRGQREKAAMEARARRERESQPWYKRAASWVMSQFNSLMSRARGLLNAAIEAGRRLLNAAREAAERIKRAAADVARRALAVADRLTGGAVSRGLAKLQQIGQAIARKISEARAWVVDKVRAARDAVVGWVREKWNQFTAMVRSIRDRVMAAVRAIRDRALELYNRARAWVQEKIDAARAWLRETWDAAVNWVREKWNQIKEAVKAFAAAVVERVRSAVQAAYQWCAQKVAEIGEALSQAWEQFKNWAQEAFVEFWNGPWRDVLIGVGVALLIAATVATGGAAGILLAAAVGAAATGAARMGGEIVARRCTVAIRNDPERAAAFEARMRAKDPNFDQSDFGQWYAGVDPNESWGRTLQRGAVEGAKGAVEGAINGLTGGAGGALGGVAARSIGRAAAREGARVLARRGVAKGLEYGARTGIEFGLNMAGDVGQGYAVAAIDVAAGNRTWEEARARYVDPHLTPGAMLAKAAGAGMSGGLRMGSQHGPRTSVQDRLVGRVTGNAGDTIRGKVAREMVDSSISGMEGGTTAGLQSMANGGGFMDGFGQGFVGGMGSHHARLAGEAYARRRSSPAPEPTGPRPTSGEGRQDVEVDVDLNTGRTRAPETDGGGRRRNLGSEVESGSGQSNRPLRPADMEGSAPPRRQTESLDVDVDGTRPRTEAQQRSQTEPQTPGRRRTQPMEVVTDMQGTTQKIEVDPDALQRAQTEGTGPRRTAPEPAEIKQKQAEAVQNAVAGRLPGLGPDQRVVPDGTAPMPAGAITVTQALRYKRTIDAMAQTPQGRQTLADIEAGRVKVVLRDGEGSQYTAGPNEIVLDTSIRGRHNRAGVLAHEGHHAVTTGRRPNVDATDRDTYVRGMLRNEAESQAALFEYHRQAGTDSSREFGYQSYKQAYDTEVATLRAQYPDAPDAAIHRMGVEAGTRALHQEFGNAKPSNSDAANYFDYYGRFHDEHSTQGTRARSLQEPEQGAPTRKGEAEPEGPTQRQESEVDATRRMTPEEVAADPLRANLDDLLASQAGQRRLYELAQEAQVDANARVGRIIDQYEGSGGGVLLKRDGEQRFIAAVEEKVRRKNYPTVGDMGDAVRGRISLEDGADVNAVLRDVEAAFPGARFDRKTDSPYPRVHVDIEMPTGIKLELQVGTHATTRFLEKTMVEIPPSLHQRVGLTEGDFHVAKYDIVDKIRDPALRQRYGLDEFDQRYNQALRNTGSGEFDAATSQRLADDLGAIMRQIEADDPALLQGLYTKDSHAPQPAEPAQPAPRAQAEQELSQPTTNYQRRRQIVAESAGEIATHKAYTQGEVPSGGGLKPYLDDPMNWVPERRALHDQLVSDALNQARQFSEEIGGDPTIYAMRGNTAAGKTTAVKGSIPELAAAGPKEGSAHRAINPDNFKVDLINADPDLRLTHEQVHAESSTLARRLTNEVMNAEGADGRRLSVLIDKRLEGEHDVTGLVEQARQTGRKFNLYDVDAPLEMSLIGVLRRQPGGDSPIVPFKAVADEGFYGSRANRMAAIEQFIGKEDGNYTLFGTNPDGSKVKVAEVLNGELTVHNRQMFEQVTADPRTDIDRVRGQRITEDLIAELTAPLGGGRYKDSVVDALRPHIGRTWEEALAEHGRAKAPQQTEPSMPAPRQEATQELSQPTTTYQRRTQVVVESNGTVQTHEAYTRGQLPSGSAMKAYLDDPTNWVPERRALHDQLLSNALSQARSFSEAVGGDKTLYAMRGNTAAGKTRAIKGNIPALEGAVEATKNSPHRAINPDNFKLDLMTHDTGRGLTHMQVHNESSALARRLHRELMGGDGSVLVDKRLEGEHDVTGLVAEAAATGRQFNLYDVDAPLEMSLVGVLLRQPGGSDPIVPFKVVADEGFYGARKNRAAAIEQFVGTNVGEYQLFGTTPDGAKVKVAEVLGGELTIHDRQMFEQLTSDPKAEIDRIRSQQITEELIAELTGPLDKGFGQAVAGALRPHLGRTWEEAVSAHGQVRKEPSMPAPRARRRQRRQAPAGPEGRVAVPVMAEEIRSRSPELAKPGAVAPQEEREDEEREEQEAQQ